MIAVAPTIVGVGAKVAMIVPAITEIGADAEGAAHRTPMHAGDRQRRERTADDGVSLGDAGR